jgi:hypothetical protein
MEESEKRRTYYRAVTGSGKSGDLEVETVE